MKKTEKARNLVFRLRSLKIRGRVLFARKVERDLITVDKYLKMLESCFGALNVDVIDMRDTEELEDAAYVCASQICDLELEIRDKF